LFVTLDGVTEAPEHWVMSDDQMGTEIKDHTARAGTLLLGRRAYEALAACGAAHHFAAGGCRVRGRGRFARDEPASSAARRSLIARSERTKSRSNLSSETV
jgi:hypothetical protein